MAERLSEHEQHVQHLTFFSHSHGSIKTFKPNFNGKVSKPGCKLIPINIINMLPNGSDDPAAQTPKIYDKGNKCIPYIYKDK